MPAVVRRSPKKLQSMFSCLVVFILSISVMRGCLLSWFVYNSIAWEGPRWSGAPPVAARWRALEFLRAPAGVGGLGRWQVSGGGGRVVVLSRCVKLYLGDCYGLAQGTKDLYAYHLERFVASVGNVGVKRVTAARLRGYLGGMRRKDGGRYSAAYVDQVYRTLNTFLKWCVAEGKIKANPLERVRRPRVPRTKSPRLTMVEVGRVLAAVQRMGQGVRNLAMVCLALDSGLRRGEIADLKMGQVDLERGVVVVGGKGGDDREVPVGDVTISAMQAYMAVRPVCDANEVFVSVRGKALTVAGLQTIMYRLKSVSGVELLRWHVCRHTFSNEWLEGGGGLRQLQKVLGHRDIRTTAAIYTDPDLDLLKRCHARASPLSSLRLNGGG